MAQRGDLDGSAGRLTGAVEVTTSDGLNAWLQPATAGRAVPPEHRRYRHHRTRRGRAHPRQAAHPTAPTPGHARHQTRQRSGETIRATAARWRPTALRRPTPDQATAPRQPRQSPRPLGNFPARRPQTPPPSSTSPATYRPPSWPTCLACTPAPPSKWSKITKRDWASYLASRDPTDSPQDPRC
jgi:hypothetical protein